MKKIIYTNETGGVSIVIPAPKESIEKTQGPMTWAKYNKHVIKRSVPKGVEYRLIEDSDIPKDREFRDAWVDETDESHIDISCERARDVQLARLRMERNKELDKEDKEFIMALEFGIEERLDHIKARKQYLRDITEPLKDLDVKGKYNHKHLLDDIRKLGKLDGHTFNTNTKHTK